jgi:hypothetical protein
MPTVQEIIAYADRRFPNSESDANKIIDLDGIHKKVYIRINKLANKFETHNDVTVKDQLTYQFPDDCSAENVILLQVSNDNGKEWYDFEYKGLLDDINGRCWTKTPDGYALVENGEPIASNDRGIRIYYYPRPATLTAVTDTPELDADYHDLLKYALVNELASQGHNPDTEIADYYQRKFDEFMQVVEYNLTERTNSKATISSVVEEEW